MKMSSLRDRFVEELRNIYSVESQLVKALAKMAKADQRSELRQIYEKHLQLTRARLERIERILEGLEKRAVITVPTRLSTVEFADEEPCIRALIDATVNRAPEAVAISAPGHTPLTYGGLGLHIHDVRRQLNDLGVGRNDRVALLAPNGPEMAVAFLAVASCATCAPLNPSYTAHEFDSYLSTLRPKALIIHANVDSTAIATAQGLGTMVVQLVPARQAEAGIFTLRGSQHARPVRDDFAHPADTALLLPTSGTTGRSKLVPLTQTNVCASARNIADSLALNPGDRGLNVMPLYHIHGLIAGILAPLAVGASVLCPPGFDVERFYAWLEEFRPSWYTAVPTLHQAILTAASSHRDIIERAPLRFIRSSSAPLPVRTASGLEEAFRVPVVEAYGMTEASHQISSNPLPPGRRKWGSVGLAMGCEVAILGPEGHVLRPGETGEIVIRGPNVMSGYEGDPTANLGVFTDGWFRTGDQGFVDAEGYVFITGRLKELINRGGAKISPYEVESVLLEHPAVSQAVAFAVPHATLGEDIAAAVVLRENAEATETIIRQFALTRLAAFKMPTQVLVVDDLPKGPSGKLQRARLAEHLGPRLRPSFVAPRDQTEEALVAIWAEVLGLEMVGIHDNFLELGGDSISVLRMLAQVQKKFGRNLPLAIAFQTATVAQLADVLRAEDRQMASSSLVAIQPDGSRPPFFCVPGIGGTVLYFREFAHHLRPDQPFYGLQSQGLDGVREPYTRIESMAAHYVNAIRALQPKGPYFLGGHSFGGLVAFEMAQQLCGLGEQVAVLALIDTYLPESLYVAPAARVLGPAAYFQLRRVVFHLGMLRRLGPWEGMAYARRKASIAARRTGHRIRQIARWHQPSTQPSRAIEDPFGPVLQRVQEANEEARSCYVPRPYPGQVVLFLARQRILRRSDPQRRWARMAAGGAEIVWIPGGHGTIFTGTQVRALARALRANLDKTLASSGHQGLADAASTHARASARRRHHG